LLPRKPICRVNDNYEINNTSMISPLFSEKSIVTPEQRRPPVIAVGLPRSGSSFLADVVSQLDGWYMFDDLYLYREAAALDAVDKPLTSQQLEKLVFFLGWQIRARIKFGLYCVPNMSLDDVDKMDAALLRTFQNKEIMWFHLLEEWMVRLAHNEGCLNWGYKAPQDFLNVELLRKAFPGVRFIFIKRDPRKMLRSLKHVTDQDGHPDQYHPVVYSLYWNKAHDIMENVSQSTDIVQKVKFEDLISDPDGIANELCEFLDARLSHPIKAGKKNTSFVAKQKKSISPTEQWICERICGHRLLEYGEDTINGRFRIRDLPELIIISLRFGFHQVSRVFRKKSSWISIKQLIFRKQDRT